MNKLEELEKKYKELGEEIERLKAEKENEVCKPKKGDKYWTISYSGGVISSVWHGDAVDEARYLLGNVFKTQEEAEFRAEQLRVEAELRRFARPFVVGEENWIINYDVDCNEIIVFRYYTFQCCNIHFPSEEIAQKAIDTVGEERIKKYYFGVKERCLRNMNILN